MQQGSGRQTRRYTIRSGGGQTEGYGTVVTTPGGHGALQLVTTPENHDPLGVTGRCQRGASPPGGRRRGLAVPRVSVYSLSLLAVLILGPACQSTRRVHSPSRQARPAWRCARQAPTLRAALVSSSAPQRVALRGERRSGAWRDSRRPSMAMEGLEAPLHGHGDTGPPKGPQQSPDDAAKRTRSAGCVGPDAR